jgi:RNA polymerase sigma-70 factor (ECF subfamily)
MMGAAPQLAEELFNEHSRRIYAYCLRQLGSREEAEDAVQATYLNACRSLNKGFEPEIAQAWLFKVAQNVCLTRRRSSFRRARLERPQDLQAVQDVVAAPEANGDELFGLDEALAGLPEQQRRAILLREWQGLSYREVAASLGLTQAAVETLIFRARRSLASALEQPEGKSRRRLLHSFDLGALLASFKSVLAGNLSASVAGAVAVAASVTTIAATPVGRGLDFQPHAPAVVPAAAKSLRATRAPRVELPDRAVATVAVPALAAANAEPRGWAGTHPRAVGKAEAKHAKGKAKSVGHGHRAKAAAPAPAQPGANSNGHAQAAQAPAHAYGRGGKKG